MATYDDPQGFPMANGPDTAPRPKLPGKRGTNGEHGGENGIGNRAKTMQEFAELRRELRRELYFDLAATPVGISGPGWARCAPSFSATRFTFGSVNIEG